MASSSIPLSVFTLNAYIFPAPVAYFASKLNNESQRVDKLAQTILEMPNQPDIMTMQELWSNSKKTQLYKQIKTDYPYKYEDKHINIFQLGSGLAMYSKYPIERAKMCRFKCWKGLHEFFAKKGFIVAKIQVDNKPIYVVTTHLQAGGSKDLPFSPGRNMTTKEVRAKQLEQIQKDTLAFIQKEHPGTQLEDHTVILTGDLNMHPGEEEYVSIGNAFSNAHNLAKKAQKILGTSYSETGEIKPSMIDHVISVGKPIKGESEIQDSIGYDISDHLAVRADIQI